MKTDQVPSIYDSKEETMNKGNQMSQSNNVPWSEIGPFLQHAKAELKEALTGTNADVPSLEITLYHRSSQEPIEEFNFIIGDVGWRILPDELIPDVTTDEEAKTDKPQDSSAPEGLSSESDRTTSGQVRPPSEIEKIVDEKINEFLRKLSGFIPDEFSYGVRTIISTTNPGDWCRGLRCEYRLAKLQWQWRRYYRQNDTCVREWTGQICDP